MDNPIWLDFNNLKISLNGNKLKNIDIFQISNHGEIEQMWYIPKVNYPCNLTS